MRLYRQLQLTEDERSRLVAHLSALNQRSMALDAPFGAALATLARLLQPSDIPAALVAHISAAAAGTHAGGSARVSCAACVTDRHDTHACGGGEGGAAGDGVWGCMLGACPAQSAAAERGLLALREVHAAHGRMRREMRELELQPGVLLPPLQIARVLTSHILTCAANADMVKLCQLATSQRRWRDLVSTHVMQQPLPAYQWLEGTAAGRCAGEWRC